MSKVEYAPFIAREASLEVVVAFVRQREEARIARVSFARHHGGPEGLPYGTDAFFHGVAVPERSPFTPGAGWRPAVRPERRDDRCYRIYMPDLHTIDGRVLASQMARMVAPDLRDLTHRLGSRVVNSSPNGAQVSIAQHYIMLEAVAGHWILHVPIPPNSEEWLDLSPHEKGNPFHPTGATRITREAFLRMKDAEAKSLSEKQ